MFKSSYLIDFDTTTYPFPAIGLFQEPLKTSENLRIFFMKPPIC